MATDIKGKKLLILGANPETANLVRVAQEMGVTTIVTDYDSNAPAKKVADISYDINGMDVDAICEMARKEKVDGVMVGVADVLVQPYQQVCEKLGLPCYANAKTAAVFNNKRLFKQTCAEYGIEGIPEYSLEDKNSIVYPVIVKPADSNSGKGITLVRHRSELDDAVARAKAESRTATVLIERYMECSDVSIYYTIVDGKIYLSTLSDRYTLRTDTSATPICLGDVFPSQYYDKFMQTEHPKYINMLKGLGVENGILYVSAFYENGHFYVYDPGFRLQGGGFHLTLMGVNGFDQRKMLINFALTGSMAYYDLDKLNDPKMHGKSAAVVWFLLKPGMISRISGIDYIKNHPSVDFAIQRFEVGEEVTDQMQGTERQVFLRVFMHCRNESELKTTIKDFQNRLKVFTPSGENLVLPSLNSEFENKFYTSSQMLKNKVIIISGGTKGVGRQLALKCAASGAKVIISGRDSASADQIIEDAKDFNGEISFKKTDLHSVAEIRDLFKYAEDKYGCLDGYVNYAGVTPAAALTEATEEHFDEVFAIDIKAAFFASQAAVELMQRSGGGSIVLVGSTHHTRGNKDRTAYACAKGALLTLSNHIGKHYACDHIRCNYLVMGWTPTDGELALRRSQGMTEDELREEASAALPLGRMTEADDIVPGIIYLLSDYSSMLTATEFKINGGEII